MLTREAIAEKLKRAEEKRKQALLNRSGAASPAFAEERRKITLQRKKQIDNKNQKQLKEKYEKDITQAEEKRRQTFDQRRTKLRKHIAKVEEIRS